MKGGTVFEYSSRYLVCCYSAFIAVARSSDEFLKQPTSSPSFTKLNVLLETITL